MTVTPAMMMAKAAMVPASRQGRTGCDQGGGAQKQPNQTGAQRLGDHGHCRSPVSLGWLVLSLENENASAQTQPTCAATHGACPQAATRLNPVYFEKRSFSLSGS